MPLVGDDFAGKYTIERVIGEGGMGVVYAATHRRLSQPVAIKMLLPNLLEHDVIVQRFEREARAAGQLRGKHAVRVMDVSEVAGMPYIVMERLDGTDLGAELDARGKFSLDEAVKWILQACSAMVEAHDRGIVHRDLKPSNLFIANVPGEEEPVLKVLDFGISKINDPNDSRVTATAVTMGTPLYMSPEQVRSARDVDARSDIWSLGIILYELLAGDTPFKGPPMSVGAAIIVEEPPPLESIRPDVPPEVADVVRRALAKNPSDRWHDARAFATALAEAAGAPPLSMSGNYLVAPRASSPQLRIPTPSTVFEKANATLPEHDASMANLPLQRPATFIGWTQHEGAPKKSGVPMWMAVTAAVFGFLILAGGTFLLLSARRAATTAASPTYSTAAPPAAVTVPAPAQRSAPASVATASPAETITPLPSEPPPAPVPTAAAAPAPSPKVVTGAVAPARAAAPAAPPGAATAKRSNDKSDVF